MAPMVHWNMFYNTELRFCDPEMELLRKIESSRRWGNRKILFGVWNLVVEGCLQTKMTFEDIVEQ